MVSPAFAVLYRTVLRLERLDRAPVCAGHYSGTSRRGTSGRSEDNKHCGTAALLTVGLSACQPVSLSACQPASLLISPKARHSTAHC